MVAKEKDTKSVKKRYYRKRVPLFKLINKIKLWPSRTGQLHGIRSIEITGGMARLTTHCSKEFVINNSLNSRAARWLRNKWFVRVCPVCRVPGWKLEKYSLTLFKRHQGSMLTKNKDEKMDIKV
jgi:pyrrolysyl-tRNA synthetase-like protein